MTKISDLEWTPHMGGEHAEAGFPNGYSASVLRGGPFYTGCGTFEIAVKRNGVLDYTTPIMDDVLGYLNEDETNRVLAEIECLPACDNGLIFYDHNHAHPCPSCCPHEQTHRQSEGQPNPGELTCTKCGKGME